MTKLYIGALALALMFSTPGLAFAASYAYVNRSGEVMSMEASNATTAIMNAPNIDEHSGVMLLDSTADMDIVGDTVSGT